MAREAARSGIHTLVSTPHIRSDFPDVHLSELADRCRALQASIGAEGIDLELVCGAEVSLVWALEASKDELVLASYAQRGTDLLIETPLGTVSGIGHHLFRLRANGFRVTLAHPERSVEFQKDPGQLQELVRQEVLLQVNARSLLEANRKAAAGRFARGLCAGGLVHVLASDGHRATDRRSVTALDDGARAAADLVGSERATWMTEGVPEAIIRGSDVPDPPAMLPASRFRRLFGARGGRS
jgi:protein-tyrosine phosphatase